MHQQRAKSPLAAIIGVLAALGLVAGLAAVVGVAVASNDPLPSELREVRAATARYHSFEQAQKDGYAIRAGEPCVASPLGTMGIHANNQALMDDPAIDLRRPEILLYLPDQNGNLKLIGVEYWKADADGNLATADDRPTLFGQAFDGPMPGHGNWGMPTHYDLHVWLWAENPSGLFAMFNPSLACPSP